MTDHPVFLPSSSTNVSECTLCKEPVFTVDVDGESKKVSIASGEGHECWDLPEDAEVIVLELPE
jgi:hypothetical protein